MRYVAARAEQEFRETSYRFYVTDNLRAITGAEQRYADILLAARPGEPEEEKTGDEIAADVIKKLGLKIS